MVLGNQASGPGGVRPGPLVPSEGMALKAALLLLVFFLTMFLAPVITEAQQGGCGMYRGMPYGQFCPGPWSRPYGAPKIVRTSEEARRLIESYYADYSPHPRCGKIEERDWYFEANIFNGDGSLMDRVIVDKRTGRIRSIY